MKIERILPFLIFSVASIIIIFAVNIELNKLILTVNTKDAVATDIISKNMSDNATHVCYIENFIDYARRKEYEELYNLLNKDFKKRTYNSVDEFADTMTKFFVNADDSDISYRINSVVAKDGYNEINVNIKIMCFEDVTDYTYTTRSLDLKFNEKSRIQL